MENKTTIHPLDPMAERIFRIALEDRRCGELLECLFDGGSATVDTHGRLILASAAALASLRGGG